MVGYYDKIKYNKLLTMYKSGYKIPKYGLLRIVKKKGLFGAGLINRNSDIEEMKDIINMSNLTVSEIKKINSDLAIPVKRVKKNNIMESYKILSGDNETKKKKLKNKINAKTEFKHKLRVSKKYEGKYKMTPMARHGRYRRLRIEFKKSVTTYKDFYNKIKMIKEYDYDSLRYYPKSYILYYKDIENGHIRYVTLNVSDLMEYEDFINAIGNIEKGDFRDGSGPVSEDQYKLLTNVYDVVTFLPLGTVKVAGSGHSEIFKTVGYEGGYCLYKTACHYYGIKFDKKKFKKNMSLNKLFELLDEYKVEENRKIKPFEYVTSHISVNIMDAISSGKGFKRVYMGKKTIYIKKCEEVEICHYNIIKDDEGKYKNKCGLKSYKKCIGLPIIFPDQSHIDIVTGIKDIYISLDGCVYYEDNGKFKKTANCDQLVRELTDLKLYKNIVHDEVRYIIFDYETVCDYKNLNINRPYSLAFMDMSEDELYKLCEYDRLKDVENVKKYLEKAHFYVDYNCTKYLYDYLQSEYSDGVKYYMVSFNGCKFDNYILYNDLKNINSECLSNVFYNGTTLLNFKIDGLHEMFDLRKHLTGSLAYNCESYKVNCCAKTTFDHAQAQKWYNEGVLMENLKKNDKLKEYNIYDIAATAVLFGKYKKCGDNDTKILGKKTEEFKTVGSMVYSIVSEHWEKSGIKLGNYKVNYKKEMEEIIKYIKKNVLDKKIYKRLKRKIGRKVINGEENKRQIIKKIRSYYALKNIEDNKTLRKLYNDLLRDKTAGRVQLFNGAKHVKGRVFSMDVCSLYPYIMAVSGVMFPVGEAKITRKYMKNKIGFYYCNVDQNNLSGEYGELPNIIGVKEKGVNNWKSSKPIRNILLSTVKIAHLKKYGAKVTLSKDKENNGICGYYFEKSISGCELFKPLLCFMKKKVELDKLKGTPGYNAAEREFFKIVLNAMSGKVIEGLHLTKIMVVNESQIKKLEQKSTIGVDVIDVNPNDLIVRIKKEEIDEMHKTRPVHLGVLIYDYSQLYMYDNIYSKTPITEQMYTDTDSCKLTEKGFKIWKKYACSNNIVHDKMVEKYDNEIKTHKLYNPKTKVFGSFEDEYKDFHNEKYEEEHYFIAKKCYLAAVKNIETGENVENKMSFKGVSMKDKIIYKENDILYVEIMEKGEKKREIIGREKNNIELLGPEDLYNAYNKGLNIGYGDNAKKMFNELYNGRDVKIFTQIFKRNVRGTKNNIIKNGVYDKNKLNTTLINTTQIINRVKNLKGVTNV